MFQPILARYAAIFLVVSLAWGYSWMGRVQSVIAQGGPTPTLRSADYFLFPLPHPTWGSYNNNRYGVQNQYLSGSSCFVNIQGTRLPRNQLYHAGSDWFHKPDLSAGAGRDVTALANGEVVLVKLSGYPGGVVIIRHRLPDNQFRFSQYGHLANIEVNVGNRVTAGDKIAVVLNQNAEANTHLHWEVRSFGAITNLYPVGSAGQRVTAYPPDYRHCNQDYGVGYTWDDDPARRYPDYWGYTDPEAFVAARLPRVFLPVVIRDHPPVTPTRTPTPTRTRTPTPTPCGYVNCPQGYPGP